MYENTYDESIWLFYAATIKRSKSWSLPVSCEVGSSAHFILKKQKQHTATVPDLPVAAQENQRGGFQ